MPDLKQSTAVEIKIGPFLDDADGKTAETALTISQADVRLAKNDGNWAQKNESTTLVHEENGWYRCLLDATDTNTLGILIVAIAESGALPVWKEYMVMPANVWDSLYGADKLDVNVEEWNATAVPAEDTAGYPKVTVKDGTGTGEINTNGGKVVGVELVDVLTTYTGNTPQTGDSFARIGAPAGASVSADVAAVKSDSAAILVDTAEMQPKLPTNNIMGSSVKTDKDDEIDAIKAKSDQLVFTTANRVDATAVTVSDKTGYALSAAGVQAIWDALTSALSTANVK